MHWRDWPAASLATNYSVIYRANIRPTRNPLSSPALSLDRLRIDYGSGRSIMVSPEDKDKFIGDIEDARRSVAAR